MTSSSQSASGLGVKQTAYRQVRSEVDRLGLLRRRHGAYLIWAASMLSALGVLFGLTIWLGDSWWQVALALPFAFVFTQFGFLGHDAAHRQIVDSRLGSLILGHVFLNCLVGASYGWWTGRHSRHHGQPNRVRSDPEIQDEIIVNTTTGVLHRRTLVGRAIVKRQGILFFILLPLVMLRLHLSGVNVVFGIGGRSSRVVEGILILLRVIGFASVIFVILSPMKAAVFLLAESSAAGVYLGCCFAPNHIGMPIVPADLSFDFLRRQVMMSRNVEGGPFVGFVMGGLNKQIEHHLFPTMPAMNFRHAAPVVREVCAIYDVPYTEMPPARAYREVIGYLNAVGSTGPRMACPSCPVAEGLRLA